jgi:uncharacterized membrane protein
LGHPDRYGGKFEGLLFLPLLTLAVYLLLLFLPRVDPRSSSYAGFRGTYSALRVAIVVFLALLYGFILLSIKGLQLNINVFEVLVGGLFVVLGILMPRISHQTWFVGIRTPWTLTSELSWRKTHRLGGWLFVLAGLVTIVLGVVSDLPMLVVVFPLLLVVVAVLFIYSYIVWKEDPGSSSQRSTGS